MDCRVQVRRAVSVVLMSLALSACNDDDHQAMPLNESLSGLWYRAGYEEYLSVSAGGATLYKSTTNADIGVKQWCNPESTFSAPDFSLAAVMTEDGRLELDAGALLEKDDAPYQYNRVAELPAACEVDAQPGNILDDYELLWHSFNSFYPYMDLHEIDWTNEYAAIRGDLGESTRPEQLIDRVAEVLEITEDIHLGLELPGGEAFAPSLRFRGIGLALQDGFSQQEVFTDFFEYALDQIVYRLPGVTNETYVNLVGEYMSPLDDDIPVIYRWGDLGKTGRDRIGYLSISSFAESDVTLLEEGRAFEEAFLYLQGFDALVIDIRGNLGGSYNLALKLAGYLVSDSTLVFNKKAYLAGEFLPINEVLIKPSLDTSFEKPVVVLQNGLSTSAAETFALATLPLPHVTLMGETSQGATASTISRSLPFSGIILTIPSDVHSTLDGISYEKVGIPPDVVASDDRLTGVDSTLIQAMEYLENELSTSVK